MTGSVTASSHPYCQSASALVKIRIAVPHNNPILRAIERSAAQCAIGRNLEQYRVRVTPLDSLCVNEKPPATDSGSTPPSPICPSPHICFLYTPSARVPEFQDLLSPQSQSTLAASHIPSSQTHTVPGRIMDRSCPVKRLVTRGTNPNLTASRMWILHRG